MDWSKLRLDGHVLWHLRDSSYSQKASSLWTSWLVFWDRLGRLGHRAWHGARCLLGNLSRRTWRSRLCPSSIILFVSEIGVDTMSCSSDILCDADERAVLWLMIQRQVYTTKPFFISLPISQARLGAIGWRGPLSSGDRLTLTASFNLI